MFYLVTFLFAASLFAPALTRRFKRNALLILALPLLVTFIWTATQYKQAFSETPLQQSYIWVNNLDLSLTFQLDGLSWLMSLIVTGVGALVMIYASRYFPENAAGLPLFTAVFSAFAAAMYGLVTANHLMMVYLFWELTTILSFLLIGHHYDRRAARAAARQAIHVTSLGSLAMFAGFVMIALPHSTTKNYFIISNLLQAMARGDYPVDSLQTIIASLLIFAGAASKSALVPNHFWLPGAMAAPTPVSSFLHSAAMVKAGVYLLARLVPGLSLIPGWSATVVGFGLATMLVGGYRALRQTDLKLVLAYGTVSQLGLIAAAVGFGSQTLLATGVVMLVAHSLFKSTLFMTVGLIEKLTGTRDLRKISGLLFRQPLLAALALVTSASMAGFPPFLGYLGKESAVSAGLFGTDATWISDSMQSVFLLILVAGSVMTAAYSLRFWWGAFGVKPGVAWCECKPLPGLAAFPLAVLAALSFYLPVVSLADAILHQGTFQTLPGHAHVAYWSGWAPALVTLAIFVGGGLLFLFRGRVEQLQAKLEVPGLKATSLYRWTLVLLEQGSAKVTAAVQRGSLPLDVMTIMLVLISMLGFSLVSVFSRFSAEGVFKYSVPLADSGLQVGAAIVAVLAAIITVRSRKRLKAVLALGVVGLSVAIIFVDYGAPDLALTQLVVEVVSLLVFVLVLRKLPKYFSDRPLVSSRWVRLAVAVSLGLVVSVGSLVIAQVRTAVPNSVLIPAEAYVFGAGKNIVNVILVDVRAWDTVGELSVLLVTATGVASLIYLTRRSQQIRVRPMLKRGKWLPGVQFLNLQQRSLMLEVSARLLFPTLVVASIWLLLTGHNAPGGGFVGGMVAGIALILRYLAGGRHELKLALPLNPGRLLGLGLFLATLSGILPLLFGGSVLQTAEFDWDLAALTGWQAFGHLHFTSALLLDVGVYILVVALVLDIVMALGAHLDEVKQEG
ncbi:Na+/H+ antiporter subunit A [Gleimia coleocanis]|uniref:Na+/H+ antiporter subunit A n=1 Tax=Gleimia coleocanis TaxID=103618 RepID=UPI000316DA09|nr:Na+/H+ antiporter subunit A [Gleimia coleocanis]